MYLAYLAPPAPCFHDKRSQQIRHLHLSKYALQGFLAHREDCLGIINIASAQTGAENRRTTAVEAKILVQPTTNVPGLQHHLLPSKFLFGAFKIGPFPVGPFLLGQLRLQPDFPRPK